MIVKNLDEVYSLLQEDEEIALAIYDWWWENFGGILDAQEASEYNSFVCSLLEISDAL